MAEASPLSLQETLAQLDAPAGQDPALAHLTEQLQRRYGAALLGIWLYGSYLRGKRDTLIDFYLVLDDQALRPEPRWQQWLERALPPNVYYLPRSEAGSGATANAHAKYATIAASALQGQLETGGHSYFWARLAQPCRLLWARDHDARAHMLQLRASAVTRALREARQLMPQAQDPLTPWTALFRQTYRAELRSEPPERADAIVAQEQDYFRTLSEAVPHSAKPTLQAENSSLVEDSSSVEDAGTLTKRWQQRRRQGKLLSLLRLMKASLTFSNGLDYLLWKVERHSGVRLEATPSQRRYPLLLAWPLVWRAWRAGGFR
jgi:hypothetical protein